MKLNNPFLDTNVIISYLFKYDPEHKLTKPIFKQKAYFSENVLIEVNYIFKEKKKLLITIFESIISILEQKSEKVIDFSEFQKIILNEKFLFIYKNIQMTEKNLKLLLKSFWNEENIINELISNLIIKLREYITYIQHNLFIEKENIINSLFKIPKCIESYPIFEKKFLELDSDNHADLKIIKDIYNFHLQEKLCFDFITFDKNLYDNLNILNYSFINKIISKKELNKIY